ncbi:MAG: metalloprotease PmbA [Gammaproteobacteria bacterium]
MTRSSLEGLVEQALADAAVQGADQAETAASLGTGLSVMVRRGEVETLEYQRDRGFTVTVYFGPRKGSASTSDLAPQAIREAVAKACSIARFTAEDPLSGLADPDLMPTEVPDLALDHPWALSPEDAIRIATECETAGLNFDPRITNSEGGTLNSHRGLRVYGNSHGFVGGYASSSHSVSCVLVATAADGGMERDYWYTASRDPATLEAIEDVGQRAAERTVARLGARKLSTRDAPVLFPAELARGLIGHFVSAIGGTSQYRRASFLLGAVGEQIFPSGFRIDERPHLPAAMASVPFDSEGVATRDRVLVDDGKLESYVLSSYSARRLGLKSTGNAGGIHNLIVGPGQGTLKELMAEMGSGFLVNELIGQGVNTVTGDYSRGAAGFWVENGEIQFPVSEITIAGNLRSMLAGIARMGGDIDARGAVRTGSLLIDNMKIAGD